MSYKDFISKHTAERQPDGPQPDDSQPQAAGHGAQAPAHQPPVRATAMLNLSVGIDMYRAEVPAEAAREIKQNLTFQNPRWVHLTRAGKTPPKDMSRYFHCYSERDKDLLRVPKGFGRRLVRILHKHGVGVELAPDTYEREVPMAFKGRLYGYQEKALAAALERRFGILAGPLGSGKKVTAAAWIAARRQPVAVIVRRVHQLYAWRTIAAEFLGIDEADIGIAGDGQMQVKDFFVTTDKMLWRLVKVVGENMFGAVVVEDCERYSPQAYMGLAGKFRAGYVLGLSVTGKRADNLTGMLHAYIGPVLHTLDASQFEGAVTRPRAVIRNTGWRYQYANDWRDMVSALSAHEQRNRDIVEGICVETSDAKIRAVVIAERRSHLDRLLDLLTAQQKDAEIIDYKTKPEEQKKIEGRFERGKLQIIMCPIKSVERLGIEKADRVFLASPMKGSDLMIQIIAKLTKGREGAAVWDYVDDVKILKGQARSRMKMYGVYGFVV